jgi:hypothetical protein
MSEENTLTRAEKTCTKTVRRNRYRFYTISYSEYWFCTKSVPSHSCFRRAVTLQSNGNQNMKTYTRSVTQRACQWQVRRAYRASRSRNAGLPSFPFFLCALRQILIGSRQLLEFDANDRKQTTATGSNRWCFGRFRFYSAGRTNWRASRTPSARKILRPASDE